MGRELLTAPVILLLAAFVFVPLRHFLKRSRLIGSYFLLAVVISVYLAVLFVEPVRLHDAADRFGWWLNRLVAGALLFVAVRAIDRLVIVRAFSRGGKTQVPRFIHQLVLIVLSVFAVLMYGKMAFGWPIADFLTGGAVISIVIGLALQESLGNLFSGLVLQAAPPFVLGDFISTGELEGRVVDMTWRAVTLHTIDDNYVVIPNGTIAKQDIVNYHAPSVSSAKSIKIGLDYELPPCDAMEVLQQAALETKGVEAAPPPVVLVHEFADSGVIYLVKFWISEPQRHLRIEHEVRVHTWYRLREKGYSIPSPTRTVEHISLREKNARLHAVEVRSREDSLRDVPLLKPLSPQQHHQLAQEATTVLLAPGQVLFHQNEPGSSLYIIQRGKAEILVTADAGGSRVIATLGPGDVIGEMSALTGQPRSATVVALSALSLVEISKGNLQQLIEPDPSILEKISELIARRTLEREAHLKDLELTAANIETVKTQQQSLMSRMRAFFKN